MCLDLEPGWEDAGNSEEGMAFCHINVLIWDLCNSLISLRKFENPLFRPSVCWKINNKVETLYLHMVPIKAWVFVNVCNNSLHVHQHFICILSRMLAPEYFGVFVEVDVSNSHLWLIISTFDTLWSSLFALPLTFPKPVPVLIEGMRFCKLWWCHVLPHMWKLFCVPSSSS